MQEGISMTIKEFYERALENNISDYTMKIQYSDDGGYYYGEDEEIYCLIYNDKKEVILWWRQLKKVQT